MNVCVCASKLLCVCVCVCVFSSFFWVHLYAEMSHAQRLDIITCIQKANKQK